MQSTLIRGCTFFQPRFWDQKSLNGATSNPIPLTDFEQLIDQYEHRLLSLEADLKDRSRTGQLAPKGFERRLKKLKFQNQQLNTLKALCKAQNPTSNQMTDIGLPILEECTPSEQEVCEKFMAERELFVRTLEKDSKVVLSNLQKTIHGKANSLQVTLWLSKLRTKIKGLERNTIKAEQDGEHLEDNVGDLLKRMGGGSQLARNKSSINALTSIFNKLETTISRVAKLRASVKHQQKKTEKFTQWLNRQDMLLRGPTPATPPPTPLETARATMALSAIANKQNPKTRRHLDLASKFWDGVINDGADNALNAPEYQLTGMPRRSPTTQKRNG